LVSCNQGSPLCYGGDEIKAVVDRLVEVKGHDVGCGNIAARSSSAYTVPGKFILYQLK
jgi:hypothetical protein